VQQRGSKALANVSFPTYLRHSPVHSGVCVLYKPSYLGLLASGISLAASEDKVVGGQYQLLTLTQKVWNEQISSYMKCTLVVLKKAELVFLLEPIF
jgi:hypothetical protein